MPSDAKSTVFVMAKRPTRIELLELDIDLRLADLWGEACGVSEWNLEVVAVTLPVSSTKEGRDDLEVPLAHPAGLAPEVREPEVDVQLEELDARRSLRHDKDRTLGVGRHDHSLWTRPRAQPQEP